MVNRKDDRKMKAIDNKELEIALETLEKEKGIKKEYLIEQIEAALITAYKNNYKDSENVKVNVIGALSALSEGMQKSIQKCMERTKDNTGVHFNIAINYGGKDEIVKAMKKIAQEVKENQISPEEIDEKIIENHLYTKGQPEPDLIIRTSGELRLSGFLIWQSAYSELLFIKKYWPDFQEEDLDNAILEYEKRKRNYGS